MGDAEFQTLYIEPQTTLRSKRAFYIHYHALNFNAPSVVCRPPQELLNTSPFFVVDGISFEFSGTVGTNCAKCQIPPARVDLDGWITTRSPQAFHHQNLGLFCDYTVWPATQELLAFSILAGYAAADDFLGITIWGYIEEPPRPTESPMRVAQDGWYSLKRRT